MKNEKVCPKCTSTEIIRVPGTMHVRGAGNNIRRGYVFDENRFIVLVTRYVCSNCGFSEEWIDEKEDIEKIKKWYESKEGKISLDNLEGDNDNFSDTPPWDEKNKML
ncbi:MAG: hypothetical protein AB8H03_01845 [Saprospiraceae bacterium]